MMPPTGLTFIVHGLVVVVEKFFSFFGISRFKRKKPMGQRSRATLSILIIIVVTVYIGTIIVFFVNKGIKDNHSNWKIISQESKAVKEKFNEAKISPPNPQPQVNYFQTQKIENYYKALPLAFKK